MKNLVILQKNNFWEIRKVVSIGKLMHTFLIKSTPLSLHLIHY